MVPFRRTAIGVASALAAVGRVSASAKVAQSQVFSAGERTGRDSNPRSRVSRDDGFQDLCTMVSVTVARSTLASLLLRGGLSKWRGY
jgi:hypothetical protein